ncbi:hypothetical protein [Novosphingobium sp. SG720]|uniref:hypothetical protein n=1 Tax=Novosphingobium sp. SG720 TaxID=2586998 RepID=UPI0014459157|nr:hypothetical protein [Novosphingobium sp. SG720]NKJ45036.1 hypothetical protein [Novosphingobium sp. SG720]
MSQWGFGIALTVALTAASAAADKPMPAIVAHGRDVFRLPPDPNYGDGCDGRRLLQHDPNFGRGLMARYLYQRGPSDADEWPDEKLLHPDDAEMTDQLRRRGLDDPSFVRSDGASANATESFVIHSHDDLTKRFRAFCEVPLRYGYFLSDIEYTKASSINQLTPNTRPEGDVEPVYVDRYLDIMPDGATVINFTVPAAYWTTRGHLRLPPQDESGVAAIFEFEGAAYSPDTDQIRELARDGYKVLYIDFRGMLETIVIDTQPVTSTEQMNARAKPVLDLEWGNQLYLKRVAYFRAKHADIANLHLPTDARNQLIHQVEQAKAHYRESDAERAKRMPTIDEIQELIDKDWNTDAQERTRKHVSAVLTPPCADFWVLQLCMDG